jgi:hypothetical protein
MIPARDERPVHLDRARALPKPQLLDELGHSAALGQRPSLSVDGHRHRMLRLVTRVAARIHGVRLARPMRRLRLILACVGAAALLAGCSKPEYDTSTPEKALQAVQKMLSDGRPEMLTTMIDIPARDVTFDDGVTEASAIGEVKGKAGDMLARLWRVSRKIKQRFPAELEKEGDLGVAQLRGRDLQGLARRIVSDPFAYIESQREKLTAEDLGDGTAALDWEGEPLFGGTVTMVERSDGWKFAVPVEVLRSSEYWPDTRHEWAVLASMMLAVENSLIDFEAEIDDGRIKSLREAGERVGRLVGESVVVQSVIYAMMKRDQAAAAPAN